MSKASAIRGGKLTKGELKRDTLVETAVKVEGYYNQNRNTVWTIAGGILAVVVAIIVLQSWMGSSAKTANYDLTMAKTFYGQKRIPEAESAFQGILSNHGGETAAEAQYYLARIKFDQGDFGGALAGFESCLSDYSPTAEMAMSSMAGIAGALEAQGRFGEAASKFEEIAAKYPNAAYAPEALTQAARLYLNQNQKDKAIAVYELIVKDFSTSQAAGKARTALGQLR